MSESPDQIILSASMAEAGPQPPAAPIVLEPVRTKSELWLETAIVLLVAVFPDLFASFWAVYWASQSFDSYASSTDYASHDGIARVLPDLDVIGRSVRVSAVVLYLIWRSRERWAEFGFDRPRWVVDPLAGGLLYVLSYYLYYVGYYTCDWCWSFFNPWTGVETADTLGQTLPGLFPTPRGIFTHLLLLTASCANGFAEELVMRAYLIPRFERLLDSTWLSLLATTVLFAAYHAYQGYIGVLNAAIVGLLYGTAFCLFRRLWPLVVAHALADYVGVVFIGG